MCNSQQSLLGYSHDYGLEQGKILVLGYDVAHPPPMKSAERRLRHSLGLTVESLEPSVVGVSPQCLRRTFSFLSDHGERRAPSAQFRG